MQGEAGRGDRSEGTDRRFGTLECESGICYARTGRRFSEQVSPEREMVAAVRAALERAALWQRPGTDWVCLDCEPMPGSAKAVEPVRQRAYRRSSRPILTRR